MPKYKRDGNNGLIFKGDGDVFKEFRPTLTPKECIRAGIFGGCYFNPRGGKPGILGSKVNIDHTEFPSSWFKGLAEDMYLSRRYNPEKNKYKVASGNNQAFWELKGWIHKQDPRGWFQWYCRFFMGRRTEDDERQMKRWIGVAGERGRWRRAALRNPSPKILQTLLHWAYEIK